MTAPDRGSGRELVFNYLRRELIGPSGDADELVADPPHRRYIMGTLYPQQTGTAELDEQEPEELESGSVGEELPDDPVELANEWMPSSVGLTLFLRGGDALSCEVWGAHYVEEPEGRQRRWRRTSLADPAAPEVHVLRAPGERRRAEPEPVLGERATLESFWRPLGDGLLVTVSLVNQQEADEDGDVDPERTLHQVGFRCAPVKGRVAEYPHVNAVSLDHEDEELRMQHRHAKVFAVGHGCAVHWDEQSEGGVGAVGTEFMPSFVLPAVTRSVSGHDGALSFAALADESRPVEELTRTLTEFVGGYEQWIRDLPAANPDLPTHFAAAAARVTARLEAQAARMHAGITLLGKHDDVLRAFRLANLAMLMQMRHSQADLGGGRFQRDTVDPRDVEYEAGPAWYPFQLAFQLLALPSMVDVDSPDRTMVDLLWFPTGGGKTEAYLALSAFEIFLRRMRHGAAGGGTTVITRYTLRLLTAQQFQRAAALVCAAELLRRERLSDLGHEPITIGLWVGEGAAPNSFAKARTDYDDMLEEDRPQSRFQLETCPWCGTELVPARRDEDKTAYGFRPENASFTFFCPTEVCPFHERLPVGVVDQELYERPPTVLIATVDKFARLAWVGRAGGFFGGSDTLAPSLIIQDELHLLSGPLGTTVGLYEAAVEALVASHGPPPKVIASTATIRRADEQARALFSRRVNLFPPPGLSAEDSYFARIDRQLPGRLYVGVMSPSHTISFTVVHAAAALLQAPFEVVLTDLEDDAYGTLVVYHNSLRELGRTVTLARDDVPARIKAIASDEHKMRELGEEAVVELTSNVSGDELPGLLTRMELPGSDPDAIGLLATTNMLSVGVDVPRLAMMLMNGQPKTTAEYIQASSRVGRGAVPGLVLTLFAATKPRDRSHYESFLPYHAALYRHVEPTSVTPFAPPSRTRGLHAALVILVRHGAGLAADDQAGAFRRDHPGVARAVQALTARVAAIEPEEADATARQLDRLLDEWEDLATQAAALGQQLYYRTPGKQHLGLLKDFGGLGPGWETLHSMRNVDRQCNLNILGS